jgi:ABC-type Fe3+ transport system permease subunit
MYRSLFNRRDRYGDRRQRQRRRWPRSRAGGCLLWIVLLIVILIVLSVLFGGFQKGTKANGLGHSCTSCTSAPLAAGRLG